MSGFCRISGTLAAQKGGNMKMYYPGGLVVNETRRIVMVLVLTAGLMFTPSVMAAGPSPVNLGSAARFTILAGAAVNITGGGAIFGDVGASPIAGSAITATAAQVAGTIYTVDATGPTGSVMDPALLTAAKMDLTTAYNDAVGRTPIPTGTYLNPNGGNIGGQNLVPGLYKFTGTALVTGADVTLTGGANDVWIFQIAADLQVGSGIQVILAGGAQAENVFWQVGTSAVLGTSSAFKGTIMADQAITMNTSSTLEGRALAFEAGITFAGNSAILPATTLSIKANGATGNVTAHYPEAVSVTVEMDPGGGIGINTDWWVVALANSSWYYLNSSFQWIQFDGNLVNCRPVYQGPLLDLAAMEVLNMPALPVGSYTVWFAVESPMDEILNLGGPILLDSVNITVQ